MSWLKKPKAAAGAIALAALAALTPLAVVASSSAVHGPFKFDPIPASAVLSSQPANAPFVLPDGFSQYIIETELSDPDFHDLPDMNQVNEQGKHVGRYLYRTHEVGSNSSVTITDLDTGETTVLAQHTHWERFDGLKWTPWQTLLAAEEVGVAAFRDPAFPNAIRGLLYEIDPETGASTAHPAIGSVSHEGIGIDPQGNIYTIDEDARGGIFMFVPDSRGDLSSGQLYAIKVTDEMAAPGAKTGTAEWVALDRTAVQTDARTEAISKGATTYGRPEDVEIIDQVLYVAITSEDRVIAIDLKGPTPFVTEFVAAGVNVPVEVDNPAINGQNDEVTGLNSPDNLAVDRAGNLYIAEDNVPGDIWVATPDKDGDGRADNVVLFASLSDRGAEPTGIYFGKDPKTLFVNVQHAADGNDKAMAITKNKGKDD